MLLRIVSCERLCLPLIVCICNSLFSLCIRTSIAHFFKANNQSKRRSNHEKTILPSIDDEDKDEEDGRSDIPDWARRDALEKTMEAQNQMNPEDIFGPLPTLVMTEVFPNYNARRSSRPRTSSSFRETYNKAG